MSEKDLIEQTEIAKTLGMSNGKFRQMIGNRAEWTIIDGKRHYEMSDVLRVIKESKDKM